MSVALQNELVGFDGKRLVTATAVGPSAAVTIANAAAATITLTLQPGYFKINNILGVLQVNGIPSGIVISDYSVSGTSVNIVVYNATAATATVAANSVTAVLLAIGW